MLDARKPLEVLNEEWSGCLRCPLGALRDERDGRLVRGEGQTNGIMFVGEGPGAHEEEEGRPFVGASGNVLRRTINALGLSHSSYITNIVACRSCGPKYDNLGRIMYRRDRRTGVEEPIIEDQKPPTPAVNACMARLYEEIYIVDPVLVVALGAEAARALLKGTLKITEKRGTTMPIRIPGVWSIPDLTTGKQVWERRQGGRVIRPTRQNYVEYLMMPTIHPAYVLRNHADESHGNAKQEFLKDMTLAANIYFRYGREAYGLNYPDVSIPSIHFED